MACMVYVGPSLCKGIAENVWLILNVMQCLQSSSVEVFVDVREVLDDACTAAFFQRISLKK